MDLIISDVLDGMKYGDSILLIAFLRGPVDI